MSRSRNKNFVSPNCCTGDSQSKWKKSYNRIFRRKAKIHLDTSIDENGQVIKDYFHRDLKKRSYADEYSSPSDGFHRVDMLTRSEFNVLKTQNSVMWYYWPRRAVGNSKTYDEYVDNFKRTVVSK
jgi:hypothetical protein